MEKGTIREMTLAWGKTPAINEDVIRVSGLGVAVCADGANGLHLVSAAEAAERGLYVAPGQTFVPLVAYHPDDEGPRSRRKDGRTKPKGLDAPENLTGPRVVQTGGPGAGSYLTETALVNPSYGEGDPRRYFDSTKVCGWVLPGSTLRALGIGLGDLAAITYKGASWESCPAGDPAVCQRGGRPHLADLSSHLQLVCGLKVEKRPMTSDEENEFRSVQRLAIKLAKWLGDVIRGEHDAIPTAIDSLRNCGVNRVREDYLKHMRERADAAALTWQKKADLLSEFSNKAKELGIESPHEIIYMIATAVNHRDGLQRLHDDQLIEALAFVVADGGGRMVRSYSDPVYTTKQQPPQ